HRPPASRSVLSSCRTPEPRATGSPAHRRSEPWPIQLCIAPLPRRSRRGSLPSVLCISRLTRPACEAGLRSLAQVSTRAVLVHRRFRNLVSPCRVLLVLLRLQRMLLLGHLCL